ncbi:hypothetical protein WN944_027145 [Citrus x changshan-huyou]|uniref:Uncharacterized protein n=1 Tax=Citrus x changshan-huyou TaxID=2935761 RepID=A0AAP0LN73_9ROSI
MNLEQFWKVSEAIDFGDYGIGPNRILFECSTIKVMPNCFHIVNYFSLMQKNSFHGEDQSRWNEATSMLEDLKQLDGALNGVMRLSVAPYISSYFRRQLESAFV